MTTNSIPTSTSLTSPPADLVQAIEDLAHKCQAWESAGEISPPVATHPQAGVCSTILYPQYEPLTWLVDHPLVPIILGILLFLGSTQVISALYDLFSIVCTAAWHRGKQIFTAAVFCALLTGPVFAQQITCEDRRVIAALNVAIAQQQQINAARERELQARGLTVPAPPPAWVPLQPLPPAADGECP